MIHKTKTLEHPKFVSVIFLCSDVALITIHKHIIENKRATLMKKYNLSHSRLYKVPDMFQKSNSSTTSLWPLYHLSVVFHWMRFFKQSISKFVQQYYNNLFMHILGCSWVKKGTSITALTVRNNFCLLLWSIHRLSLYETQRSFILFLFLFLESFHMAFVAFGSF